jgi:hypothetical protein
MECQTEKCKNKAVYAKDSLDFSKSFNFSFIYYCKEHYAQEIGRDLEEK